MPSSAPTEPLPARRDEIGRSTDIDGFLSSCHNATCLVGIAGGPVGASQLTAAAVGLPLCRRSTHTAPLPSTPTSAGVWRLCAIVASAASGRHSRVPHFVDSHTLSHRKSPTALDRESAHGVGQAIYKEYVDSNGMHCVNLDSATVAKTKALVASPTTSSFDDAQARATANHQSRRHSCRNRIAGTETSRLGLLQCALRTRARP